MECCATLHPIRVFRAPFYPYVLGFFYRDGYEMDGSRLRVEISRGRRDNGFGMGGFRGGMGMGMGMRGGFRGGK